MSTDYLIVRIKSDNEYDFLRVRHALHQLSEALDIAVADVPVRQDRRQHFHRHVEALFNQGMRLTSRWRENPSNT